MAEKDPRSLKKIKRQHARRQQAQALQKAVLVVQRSGHIGRGPSLKEPATYSQKTTRNLGRRLRAILIGGRNPDSVVNFIGSRLGSPRQPNIIGHGQRRVR